MITAIVSFDGYTFGSFEDEAGLPWASAQGQWTARADIVSVQGSTSRHAGGRISERRIDAQIVVDALLDEFTDELDAVLGKLRPDDTTPRRLVAKRHDNTLVETLATVELRPAEDDSIDTLFVTFVAADPVWRATVPATASLLDAFNPSFETDLTHWASANTTSGVTVVTTRDAVIFADRPGSQKVEITANSAGINAITDRFNTNFLPATAGQVYVLTTSARRSTTGLTPQQFVAWYNGAQALLSVSAIDGFAPVSVSWERRAHHVTAPASTAFARIFSRVLIPGAGTLGTVWFDDVYFAEEVVEADQIAIANDGQATVNPLIRVVPQLLATGQSLTKRRRFTLHNGLAHPLDGYPYRLDLGDTSGWDWGDAAGHAQVAPEFYVFRDGRQVRRYPINLDDVQSYCWILLDDLPAGEQAEYLVCYKDAISGEPPLEMSGIGNIHRPAFDIAWERNTATSGTTSSITRTGAGWQTNQWRHGLLEIISGTGAGANVYQVTSNTDTTLSISGTFLNGTPNNTSVYLVYMGGYDPVSDATWWPYDIRQVERSDPERGLWYTSGAGQSPPQEVRFDTPASWYPVSLLDNNDERVQKEVTPFNPGGTPDFVTGLDANRTWQGGSSYSKGARKHDGVAFDSPVPIVSLRADFQFKNPNGMAKAFIGAKEGAGADYEAILENTTASDILATITAATYTMPAATHHLAVGLLPRNDQEIPLSWSVDDGTATSGTSTTMTDSTKLWEIDQWIGGTARIVSGTGAGGAAAITDSNATSVTVASWPNGTPDATSRYQLRQKSNDATLRGDTTWRLLVDEGAILFAEALTAEEDNIWTGVVVSVDSADASAPEWLEVAVGIDDRKVFLGADEELRIDCCRRLVSVHTTAVNGDLLRTLGGGYVRPVRRFGVNPPPDRLGEDWLPLSPGAHTLQVLLTPTALTLSLEIAWQEGYLS